jgi:hypothetical protein
MTDALLGLGRELRSADRRSTWLADPVAFARDCVVWPTDSGLTGYQSAVLAGLARNHRMAVRSPHGAGKTATTALSVLWFGITRDLAGRDWKVVTTAGAWRQLERYLWPEIHLWARRLRWDVIGRPAFDLRTELLTLNLKLSHGQAFAAASDDPALIEGAHADSLLVCLDEAKAIPGSVFDAVEGALSGQGEALALATSTPGEPAGRFYDIHARKPGLEDWAVRHVTLADTIAAGRVSDTWAKQRAAQWGESSAVYANRVLGEFATSDTDGVIPLAWVEDAIDRWRAWDDGGRREPVGRRIVGVDVARSGSDRTVIASRQGPVILDIEHHSMQDTMVTTGQVAAKLTYPGSTAVVDVIGIGAGVVDRLREQRLSVNGFHASERSTAHDKSGELGFLNKRAEAWWQLRDLLDPARGSTVALPDNDELIGDLCAPRWKMTSAGKIQIESKDDIRKRLGRSTDVGDAVVQAFTLGSGASGDVGAAVRWTDEEIPGGAVRWNDQGSVFAGSWSER